MKSLFRARKDGMNPVSRKHNDALFTIAPVNVNAVCLVLLGLIPFWSYHKIRTFYYLRQMNKINPKTTKICLSKGMQCCKDPKRCMTGSLSQPETMLDVSQNKKCKRLTVVTFSKTSHAIIAQSYGSA